MSADPVAAGDTAETTPGHLRLAIEDRRVEVSMVGGGSWSIPIGPVDLVENELTTDPPRPAELTNALGFVHDYFDDIVVEAPSVLAAPSIGASGPHARALAAVELGHADIPDDYHMTRSDADEVFRTLVAEPVSDRLHNPGLDPDHVDTVIGTLCVILAIVRRLDLGDIHIETARR